MFDGRYTDVLQNELVAATHLLITSQQLTVWYATGQNLMRSENCHGSLLFISKL